MRIKIISVRNGIALSMWKFYTEIHSNYEQCERFTSHKQFFFFIIQICSVCHIHQHKLLRDLQGHAHIIYWMKMKMFLVIVSFRVKPNSQSSILSLYTYIYGEWINYILSLENGRFCAFIFIPGWKKNRLTSTVTDMHGETEKMSLIQKDVDRH